MGRPTRRDADSIAQLMDQHGQSTSGSGSKWTGLAILAAIAIVVPCGLVLAYKKWFAGEPE